ncbi:MAG TPA: hypothetical protein VMY99_05630 [Nevskiaceae bacterium]|nr:hypothetical protein [Nevskiaceae bacterium]
MAYSPEFQKLVDYAYDQNGRGCRPIDWTPFDPYEATSPEFTREAAEHIAIAALTHDIKPDVRFGELFRCDLRLRREPGDPEETSTILPFIQTAAGWYAGRRLRIPHFRQVPMVAIDGQGGIRAFTYVCDPSEAELSVSTKGEFAVPHVVITAENYESDPVRACLGGTAASQLVYGFAELGAYIQRQAEAV